jgi:hypothetical protein
LTLKNEKLKSKRACWLVNDDALLDQLVSDEVTKSKQVTCDYSAATYYQNRERLTSRRSGCSRRKSARTVA